MVDSLEGLRDQIRAFAAERDWARFHTAKNLAMAVAGEAGELVAELQWLSDPEIKNLLGGDGELSGRLAEELADILIYLVRLADVCDVDLLTAAAHKIDLNEARYPTELARGRATKYNQLRRPEP